MSVRTYKSIKSLTQLVGVLAAAYALYLGTVEPFLPLIIIASIILGPEYVEAHIINSDASLSDNLDDEK